MRKSNRIALAVIVCLLSAASGPASGTGSAQVRFKTGEMSLASYVEMASKALDLQLDASAIDPEGKEVVTVTAAGPMEPASAMARLLSQLALEGYTLIHDADIDVYRVLKSRDARDDSLPLVTDPSLLQDNDLMVTYRLELRHYSAEAMARNMRNIAPAASRLVPVEGALFLTDSSRSMKKYRDVASRLDTPEIAKELSAQMAKYAEKRKPCPSLPGPSTGFGPGSSNHVTQLVLYSLVALVIGFLARGYLIRRIEGGL